MSFNALVLAGARPGGDPLSGHEGASCKALIVLDGKTLLERVVGALKEAGAARIAVSSNDEGVIRLCAELGAEAFPAARGPSQSVAEVFAALGAPLLVTTADHALLEAAWVRQMVEQTPADCDLSVMLAERAAVEAAMPGSRRTYLKFADGAWSGCNLFYLRTPGAGAAINSWQQIEADRKRPWRIASRLGWGSLIDYALGRLSLAEGLAKMGRRIGVEARLVAAENGLAAVDVDKVQDLSDIRQLIENLKK